MRAKRTYTSAALEETALVTTDQTELLEVVVYNSHTSDLYLMVQHAATRSTPGSYGAGSSLPSTSWDTTNDTLLVTGVMTNHFTGCPVRVAASGLPTGLSANTTYYLICDVEGTPDYIQFASSYENALAGTEINLGGTPSGDVTVTVMTLVEVPPVLVPAGKTVSLSYPNGRPMQGIRVNISSVATAITLAAALARFDVVYTV